MHRATAGVPTPWGSWRLHCTKCLGCSQSVIIIILCHVWLITLALVYLGQACWLLPRCLSLEVGMLRFNAIIYGKMERERNAGPKTASAVEKLPAATHESSLDLAPGVGGAFGSYVN